jgi:hypothetical protein
MRFSTAIALTMMTSTKIIITSSITYVTNESPRSPFSSAVINIAPTATLAMVVATRRQSAALPVGVGII